MTAARTPEEVAGGFIRVQVGKDIRSLPTLKIRAERLWREQFVGTLAKTGIDVDLDAMKKGGDEAFAAMAPLANLATDKMIEQIVAYDTSAALGGLEYLETNLDSAQVYGILRSILGVVFPFVTDLRSAVVELTSVARAAGLLGRSVNSNSTNGVSPTGDGTPKILKPASTDSN